MMQQQQQYQQQQQGSLGTSALQTYTDNFHKLIYTVVSEGKKKYIIFHSPQMCLDDIWKFVEIKGRLLRATTATIETTAKAIQVFLPKYQDAFVLPLTWASVMDGAGHTVGFVFIKNQHGLYEITYVTQTRRIVPEEVQKITAFIQKTISPAMDLIPIPWSGNVCMRFGFLDAPVALCTEGIAALLKFMQMGLLSNDYIMRLCTIEYGWEVLRSIVLGDDKDKVFRIHEQVWSSSHINGSPIKQTMLDHYVRRQSLSPIDQQLLPLHMEYDEFAQEYLRTCQEQGILIPLAQTKKQYDSLMLSLKEGSHKVVPDISDYLDDKARQVCKEIIDDYLNVEVIQRQYGQESDNKIGPRTERAKTTLKELRLNMEVYGIPKEVSDDDILMWLQTSCISKDVLEIIGTPDRKLFSAGHWIQVGMGSEQCLQGNQWQTQSKIQQEEVGPQQGYFTQTPNQGSVGTQMRSTNYGIQECMTRDNDYNNQNQLSSSDSSQGCTYDTTHKQIKMNTSWKGPWKDELSGFGELFTTVAINSQAFEYAMKKILPDAWSKILFAHSFITPTVLYFIGATLQTCSLAVKAEQFYGKMALAPVISTEIFIIGEGLSWVVKSSSHHSQNITDFMADFVIRAGGTFFALRAHDFSQSTINPNHHSANIIEMTGKALLISFALNIQESYLQKQETRYVEVVQHVVGWSFLAWQSYKIYNQHQIESKSVCGTANALLVSVFTAYYLSEIAKLTVHVVESMTQMIGDCISDIWHPAGDHGGHNNDTHHANYTDL